MKFKHIIIITLLFLIAPLNSNANTIYLEKCIDGDTFKTTVDGELKSVRLLAIDTPETYKEKEEYGEEAKDFTCNLLSNAKEISLEFDENSDKEDKYNRLLAWVWVDGNLLQEELIKNGLAEVAYLYGDYKYTALLKKEEIKAKENEINLWSKEEEGSIKLTVLDYLLAVLFMLPVYFITRKKNKTISNIIYKKITNKTIKIIIILIYIFSIYPPFFDILAFTGKKINIKKLLKK